MERFTDSDVQRVVEQYGEGQPVMFIGEHDLTKKPEGQVYPNDPTKRGIGLLAVPDMTPSGRMLVIYERRDEFTFVPVNAIASKLPS